MRTITLAEAVQAELLAAVDYTKGWCHEHQAEVGLAEIALGGGLLAFGIHNGLIEMGRELVGVVASKFNPESLIGAAAGGSLGGVGGLLLGSIGIATAGGAVGVPAVLLAGGGAVLMAAAGYTVGDLLHNFLHPAMGIQDWMLNGGLLFVGVGLILDGCRRITKDPRVRSAVSGLKDGVLRLIDLGQVDGVTSIGGIASMTAGAAGGAGIGVAAAGSSVTLLGSSTLGTAAVSLGLTTPPLWPVIALAAGGVVVGGAGWLFLKRWNAGRRRKRPSHSSPLLATDDRPGSPGEPDGQ